jgi:hypothetical protein
VGVGVGGGGVGVKLVSCTVFHSKKYAFARMLTLVICVSSINSTGDFKAIKFANMCLDQCFSTFFTMRLL